MSQDKIHSVKPNDPCPESEPTKPNSPILQLASGPLTPSSAQDNDNHHQSAPESNPSLLARSIKPLRITSFIIITGLSAVTIHLLTKQRRISGDASDLFGALVSLMLATIFSLLLLMALSAALISQPNGTLSSKSHLISAFNALLLLSTSFAASIIILSGGTNISSDGLQSASTSEGGLIRKWYDSIPLNTKIIIFGWLLTGSHLISFATEGSVWYMNRPKAIDSDEEVNEKLLHKQNVKRSSRAV